MTKVNLLPEKSRLKLIQLETVGKLKKYIFVFVAIFAIWSGVILAADIYFSSQLGSISAKLDSAKTQINDFLPMVNSQYQARYQIKNAATVLKERTSFSSLLEAIYALLGEGAIVENFNYEKKEISLNGFWPNITSLGVFEEKVNQLNNESQDVEFQLISAEQFSIETEGVNFSLKITPKNAH